MNKFTSFFQDAVNFAYTCNDKETEINDLINTAMRVGALRAERIMPVFMTHYAMLAKSIVRDTARDPQPFLDFVSATGKLAWHYAPGIKNVIASLVREMDYAEKDVAHLNDEIAEAARKVG